MKHLHRLHMSNINNALAIRDRPSLPDVRDTVVNREGYELYVLCGPSRFRLRMQGSRRWVSEADIDHFASDASEALLFATRQEAFAFARHIDLMPDEDGNYGKPLAHLVTIEEVSE